MFENKYNMRNSDVVKYIFSIDDQIFITMKSSKLILKKCTHNSLNSCDMLQIIFGRSKLKIISSRKKCIFI